MCTDGKIYFNQCNAGRGAGGTNSLTYVADRTGVPVSGPESTIKGCRIFGGALTSYKEVQPTASSSGGD